MNGNNMVQVLTFLSAVTANGNGSAVSTKWGQTWTLQATITGTGAVSATVQLQGSNDGTNWINDGTALSLTGTNSDSKAVTSTNPYAFRRATVASITGTGATITAIGAGI